MPYYVYSCPEHGTIEIKKTMAEAGRAEFCTACFLSGLMNVELRRIYTPPTVQNLAASVDSLCSWGHDERRTRVHKDVWLAEQHRARQEIGPLED